MKLQRAGIVDVREQAARLGMSVVNAHRVRRAAREQGIEVVALPPGRRVRADQLPPQLVLRLPERLMRRLRRWCERERVSMNVAAARALDAFLR